MVRRFQVTAGFFLHLARDVVGSFWALLARRWRRVVLGEETLVVGVDIFPFFERMTGVGWYEWNLLARLPETDPVLQLNLYAHSFAAPDEPSPPVLPTGTRTRFRFHHIPEGFVFPIRATVAVLRALVEPVLMFLDDNDVFFAPNFFAPRRHQTALRELVATVHDLAFLRRPDTVQQETLDNLHRRLPRALFGARALIAVSEATARDLTELTGTAPRRIHVIHEGVDPAFSLSAGIPPDSLPERYVLFLSTLEPRKNIVGLLEGFRRAVTAGYTGDLVLVGRWGWRTEAAQRALATSPVRERIHHLDYLDRSVLNTVMRRAEALLFPSLLEGFGLPVVEAMACGVPVIVSDATSLPEVAGEAGYYVNPHDADSIAAGIIQVGADPAECRRRIELGLERAGRFRWEEAAAATVGVLRRAAGLEERYPDAYRV